MSDTAKMAVSVSALVLSGLALVGGVGMAIVAGVQGNSGGGTAFLGMLAVLALAALALVVGIVGAAIGRERARWLALLAVGGAVLAPIVSFVLVVILVPGSAFKI